MRRRHWLAMLMLLCAAAAGADTAKFLTAGPRIGQTRYLVTVETSGVEDVHARMADLLASCACENVPDLDVDPGAFVITASPEAAETLSRDTRGRLVVEIAPEGEVRAPERRAAEARAVPAAGVTLQPETNTTPYWSVSYAYDKSGNVKSAGAAQYEVWRRWGSSSYSLMANNAQSGWIDSFGIAGRAYIYVRAAKGDSALSWPQILPAGVPAPAPGVGIRRAHLEALRQQFTSVLQAVGIPVPAYTNANLVTEPAIRAIHLTELQELAQ